MSSAKCRNYRSTVGNTEEFGIKFEDPSLAVQASREETDINNIVKRYMRTGELPQVRQGVFADISEMVDLRDAIHMVNEANQAFMELPAEVRREFDHDPAKLVEFAQSTDPKDREKAIRLGLIAPSAPESGASEGADAPKGPTAPEPAKAGPPVST